MDRLLGGGLPRGEVSEITGPASCGKTALLFRVLARATGDGETVAFVDAFDSLDPAFARQAGIDLHRMLWVRPRHLPLRQQVFKALKAADILVRSEAFGLVVLDLQPGIPSSTGSGPLRRVPFNVWQRLKRLLRGKDTSLLLLGDRPFSGSAASLVLNLEEPIIHWHWPEGRPKLEARPSKRSSRGDSRPPSPAPHPDAMLSHTGLLWGISSRVRLSRGKRRGQLTVHSRL